MHWCRPVIERRSGETQQGAFAADAGLRVVVIDQLAQFTSVRAAEISFEQLQIHLELSDLMDQLSLLGLDLGALLALVGAGERLTVTIEKLPLPLAHLDGVNGVVGSDLLDRLAATDRFHSDLDPEFGTVGVGAALTHRWEPRSGGMPRLRR